MSEVTDRPMTLLVTDEKGHTIAHRIPIGTPIDDIKVITGEKESTGEPIGIPISEGVLHSITNPDGTVTVLPYPKKKAKITPSKELSEADKDMLIGITEKSPKFDAIVTQTPFNKNAWKNRRPKSQ